MAFGYSLLATRIAQITHRDDLTDQMAFFINDAVELLSDRLGFYIPRANATDPDTELMLQFPNLYLYASLIEAYEFINEMDMAGHYYQRYLTEVDRYYITSTESAGNQPVMGEEWVPAMPDPLTA